MSEHIHAAEAKSPRTLDALTELPRTLGEVGLLGMQWGSLIAKAPRGEPHPVMVLPGFMGDDASTGALRRLLTRLKYKALPWLQGGNTGNPEQLEGAMRLFYRMHHGMGTKISLVGQSLGGVYAREIAKAFPDAVRCVITLGSPYGATDGDDANPVMEELFERMSGLTVEELRARIPQDRQEERLAMPATSVYSKADGVVAWQTCIEPQSEISENIQVLGSHTGMAMNPAVIRIVVDRLAQDPANWIKFDRSSGSVCGCAKFTYPPESTT